MIEMNNGVKHSKRMKKSGRVLDEFYATLYHEKFVFVLPFFSFT